MRQHVGEAVRAPRAFAECGPVSRASTLGVLLVEFVQLNALAFNPAIGVATNAFGASSEMHWKYEDIAKPNNAVMSRNPP